MFVSLDDDYEIQLTIWTPGDGKQVEYQLAMPSLERSDMNQRITEIVFGLLSSYRKIESCPTEKRTSNVMQLHC